jgi:putative MATE family efflux protein
MKTDHILQLAHGRLSSMLWRMCMPAVAAMTINGIYNVVDAFFIGLTEDPGAIGAVSVIFPLFVLISALGVGISVGAGAYISRCLGAGDMTEAQKAAGASLIISVMLGAAATAAGFIWLQPMLHLLGAREIIMPSAVGYTSWILFGNIFVMLNAVLAGAIRAEGNAVYATIALLTGTLLNIALDPIFIFALDLGIKGAAMATLISYVVTFMFSAAYYVFKKAVVPLRPRFSDISKKNMSEIGKIGAPAMIKQLLLAAVFSIINIMSAHYGEDAVTAAGICAKINAFVAMTLLGIGQGFMPIAAFNLGAKRIDRLLGATYRVLLAAMLFAAVSGTVYVIFGHDIVALFCRDTAVTKIGGRFMQAFAAGVIPLGFAFMMDALFSACGRARQAMLLSVSRQGLIFAPVIFIAQKTSGLDGIIWASAISDALCGIGLALPLFLIFVRQIKKDTAAMLAGKADSNESHMPVD